MTRTLGFVALAIALAPSVARADGAFPDELAVFTPDAAPSRIVLAANFGILQSEDDGQTWYYVCEALAGASGNINLYQYGPSGTLFGDSFSGLLRSGDQGCSWSMATGCFPGPFVADSAFDPANPGKAVAIAAGDAGGLSSAVYPTSDDGHTFGCPVFSTPDAIQGVDFCRSESGTVWVVGNQVTDGGVLGVPFVTLGYDGGTSWTPETFHPELTALTEPAGSEDGGAGDAGAPRPPIMKLLQVDPHDCATAYFRLINPAEQDFVAVTHDRGATIQVIFQAPQPMNAFLASADGTLYVGMRNGGLWSAAPGTTTFEPTQPELLDAGKAIHPRCLSERGGLLYACGDNWLDKFALGVSSDHGATWTGLLQFVNLAGLAACPGTDIAAACANTWCGPPGNPNNGLVSLFGIPDAGWPCDAGVPGGTSGGGGGGPPPAKGCGGCNSAGGAGALLAVAALALALRKRRG